MVSPGQNFAGWSRADRCAQRSGRRGSIEAAGAAGSRRRILKTRTLDCGVGRYSKVVKHQVQITIPTAETPALSDEERADRRRRFIERVFSPDGLDRETLEHIEQLTGDES